MFNWDLFRQCNSWKKKWVFLRTHYWVKEDGKSNKWVSCLSCQFPYTISASNCFSFFGISAPMDSPQTWQQEQPIVQKPWAAWELFLSSKVSDMVWGTEEAQTSPGLLHIHAFWVFSIENHGLCQRSKNFSLKGQRVNILGFTTHVVSVTAIHFCCITQRATEHTQPNECGYVPLKLYLEEKKKKSRQQAIVCNLWVILSHFYGKSGSIINILTNKATCHMALSYVP